MTLTLGQPGVKPNHLLSVLHGLILLHMNTEKFKSVAVPMEVYKEIKILAQHEDRPISNQLIKILREWKEDRIKEAEHLSLPG